MQDPNFIVYDANTSEDIESYGQPYTGPVAGLQTELVTPSPDNLYVVPFASNSFIHTGDGQDIINLGSTTGTNVVDGGAGSAIMNSGSGNDTFFLNAHGATSDMWNTITNFHAGDAATLWGVTGADFAMNWAANDGAPGYQGETLHAMSTTGGPNMSVTFAGAIAPLAMSENTALNYTYLGGAA